MRRHSQRHAASARLNTVRNPSRARWTNSRSVNVVIRTIRTIDRKVALSHRAVEPFRRERPRRTDGTDARYRASFVVPEPAFRPNHSASDQSLLPRHPQNTPVSQDARTRFQTRTAGEREHGEGLRV
ncbi:hypothetical protein AAFF_G00171250 [Aldrovandia affinis]|uniref:Uncharacterized protein n=1 Tax=Aldrovandia affinis TaxID=143900 RepID=A0AAD7RLV0_9TELE|nr:hypothetical protein AAFF_G00171250 [Aldrovandia affinis]